MRNVMQDIELKAALNLCQYAWQGADFVQLKKEAKDLKELITSLLRENISNSDFQILDFFEMIYCRLVTRDNLLKKELKKIVKRDLIKVVKHEQGVNIKLLLTKDAAKGFMSVVIDQEKTGISVTIDEKEMMKLGEFERQYISSVTIEEILSSYYCVMKNAKANKSGVIHFNEVININEELAKKEKHTRDIQMLLETKYFSDIRTMFFKRLQDEIDFLFDLGIEQHELTFKKTTTGAKVCLAQDAELILFQFKNNRLVLNKTTITLLQRAERRKRKKEKE